jgi:hypothetical protein
LNVVGKVLRILGSQPAGKWLLSPTTHPAGSFRFVALKKQFMKVKRFLALICSIALLTGCQSTSTGGTGNKGNGSRPGFSSQGSGSGAGGVENNANQSGVGTGTTGAGHP